MAITTRFLVGSLNGLLGPIRAYTTEVCRPEHQAIGLSLDSTSWAMGLIIGSVIGGYLAQPTEKYPKLFPGNSLFGRYLVSHMNTVIIHLLKKTVTIDKWLQLTVFKNSFHRYPYLLPSLCISVFCFIIFISCMWLPETLHDLKVHKKDDGPIESPVAHFAKSEELLEQHITPTINKNLFKNWPLMSSIILYCIICFDDMAYTEVCI
jgi:MFS family permease